MMLHCAFSLGVCVLNPYIADLAAAVVGVIPAAAASPKRRLEWKFGMKILHVFYELLT